VLQLEDLLPVCRADVSINRTAPIIAVNATHLYFILVWDLVPSAEATHLEAWQGYLMRVPLAGGKVERLAEVPRGTGETPHALALTSHYAVFIQAGGVGKNATIARVPLEGGEVTVLAEATRRATAVVADDDVVYFTDELGAKSVPLEGGEVQVLVSGIVPTALGLLNGTLYVATSEKIYAVSIKGGEASAVADMGGWLLEVCGDGICWLSGAALDASLMKLVPGETPVVLADGIIEPHSLTFDGSHFFVAEGMSDISRISADGTSRGRFEMTGVVLAANESCLFWSEYTAITGIARVVADAI
jgi:hypothetical protein